MRGVCDGPLHLLDPRPSAGDLEQTLLNEVFRLCEVPGDQVGRPQQRLSRLGDEAVEVNPGLALIPTSVHYLLQPSCVFERLPPITANPEKARHRLAGDVRREGIGGGPGVRLSTPP